jgi:hypothetical protein
VVSLNVILRRHLSKCNNGQLNPRFSKLLWSIKLQADLISGKTFYKIDKCYSIISFVLHIAKKQLRLSKLYRCNYITHQNIPDNSIKIAILKLENVKHKRHGILYSVF